MVMAAEETAARVTTYQQIVEDLVQHQIQPVIHTVLLKNALPYDSELNTKTAALSAALHRFRAERDCRG